MSIEDAVREIMASRYVPRGGDRVRVLSRPECQYCREQHDQEIGLTGTVWEIGNEQHPHRHLVESEADFLSHGVWVDLDEPVNNCSVSHFAPAELELVSEPLAAADARRGEGSDR